MTDYTQTTHLAAGKAGEQGQDYVALSSYALTGAVANGDTFTFTNLLPKAPTCQIIDFEIWGVELDTGGSPSLTFTVGDGTDADGYLTTKGGAVGLQNSLAGQLFYKGDGAIIGAAAGTAASRNVKITITAGAATAASSGKIFVKAICRGI